MGVKKTLHRKVNVAMMLSATRCGEKVRLKHYDGD